MSGYITRPRNFIWSCDFMGRTYQILATVGIENGRESFFFIGDIHFITQAILWLKLIIKLSAVGKWGAFNSILIQFSLHIYSVYIFIMVCNFLSKFWRSDQRLESLQVHFYSYDYNLKHLPMHNLRLLVNAYYSYFFLHGINWKLTLRIPLDMRPIDVFMNVVTWLFLELFSGIQLAT